MKKIICMFIAGAIPMTAMGAQNPMFCDGCDNSITLYLGQSTGSGTLFKLVDPSRWRIMPQTLAMGQYSQPMTIFRLPARMNFNVVQNVGYHSGRGLSFFAVGISWDAVPITWHGFYAGVGIGPYMRDSRDRWVDSRLVFGEKFFIGKNISDKLRAEFFTQHFSNGNFTDVNLGFNFTGLSVNYSF